MLVGAGLKNFYFFLLQHHVGTWLALRVLGWQAEPAVTPPVSPERARLRNAVLEVTRENPGMGVKKMVALIKQHSPELSSVGAKEVRQMIAVLNQ